MLLMHSKKSLDGNTDDAVFEWIDADNLNLDELFLNGFQLNAMDGMECMDDHHKLCYDVE